MDFIRLNCRHVKGDLRGQRIVLHPSHVFIVTNLFGWLRGPLGIKLFGWSKRHVGSRRFRSCYLEKGRKNAKSTLLAGIALYLLLGDDEPGAEVYCAATTYKQARLVFDIAERMVRLSPALRELLITSRSQNAAVIADPLDGSKMEPVHSTADSLEGLDVHAAIIDELHAHKDGRLLDVLTQGKAARLQPLIVSITTAGNNMAGPCYELRDYTAKVLNGVLEDEAHFGMIFTLDKGDDWNDPATWAKANPLMDAIDGLRVELGEEYRKAKASARYASAFKTKRLNIWIGALEAYFNMSDWEDCAVPGLSMDGMVGVPCFAGADLSTERDMTAVAVLFKRELETTHTETIVINPTDDDEEGEEIEATALEMVEVNDVEWSLFVKLYLPEAALEDPENKNAERYRAWADEGWLTITPGIGTDFEAIKADLRECYEKYDLTLLGYDQYQAHQLAQELSNEGFDPIKIAQTAMTLSAPTKRLDKLIATTAYNARHDRSGDVFRHEGNPAMEWSMGNVAVRVDTNDNIKPNKEFPQNKIDGPIASIMAVNVAMHHEPEDTPAFYPG